MVHPKHHHSIAVVVLLGIVLLFALLLFSLFVKDKKGTTEVVSDSETQDIYISKLNDFSIDLTGIEYGNLHEDYNEVVISKNNGDSIRVDVIGTNYETPELYLLDLSEKNHFAIESQEKVNINNYPTIKVSVIIPSIAHEGTIEYLIYPDKWIVYTLSTSSPDLYDELDQIAQSFKYLPPENSQN